MTGNSSSHSKYKKLKQTRAFTYFDKGKGRVALHSAIGFALGESSRHYLQRVIKYEQNKKQTKNNKKWTRRTEGKRW